MQKKKDKDIVFDDSKLGHHPFENLKGMIKSKVASSVSEDHQASQKNNEKAGSQPSEEEMFWEAMKGVNPIPRVHAIHEKPAKISFGDRPVYTLEKDELSRLARLIDHGEGFVVSDTPEYMEGTGYHVRQEFARRLHEGDFTIQAHIDLHGMNVERAEKEFVSFLKASYLSGKRAVLVVHGRGLSSPGEAILKNKVREWLSLSYWRKRVLAYASAQSHDGGAGATYVLFRERPVSRNQKK